jgi:hypothetical protein
MININTDFNVNEYLIHTVGLQINLIGAGQLPVMTKIQNKYDLLLMNVD